MALKRYEQATTVIERALGIGEKAWGATHPQYGLLLHSRGELAVAMESLETAETYLTRALRLYDQHGYAVYTPLALYQLAQVSARLGKQEPALDCLERALELGYRPAASAPAFVADPQLASLRAHPRFKALASVTPRQRAARVRP